MSKIFNEGEFSKEKFFEYLNQKMPNKINREDFETLFSKIEDLLKFQNLSYKDIEFLDVGQSYTVLGIGQAVIKIGPNIKNLDNPYQLLPFHEEKLEQSNQMVYFSQRGDMGKTKHEDVQKLYNKIRESGGIWLDPKENNVATVENPADFSEILEPNEELYQLDKELSPNEDGKYIVDYEDVMFLTPEIVEELKETDNMPYGKFTNPIIPKFLDLPIEEIYEKSFIMHNLTLLEYEEQYQRSKNNIELANKYKNRRKEIIAKQKEEVYKINQRAVYGRARAEIGNRYSAKEIGIQIMQKVSLSRIKRIVSEIKERFSDRNISEQQQPEEIKLSYEYERETGNNITAPANDHITSPANYIEDDGEER